MSRLSEAYISPTFHLPGTVAAHLLRLELRTESTALMLGSGRCRETAAGTGCSYKMKQEGKVWRASNATRG